MPSTADKTPDQTTPALEAMLCFDVYALQHALAQVYKPLLAPLGLTYPQYLVMVLMWDVQQASVSEIGRRLDLETSTLTPLLKRIETAGLVTRSRDPADERRVLVALTKQGRALAKRADGISACILEATGMDERECALFHRQLRQVRSALIAYSDERG